MKALKQDFKFLLILFWSVDQENLIHSSLTNYLDFSIRDSKKYVLFGVGSKVVYVVV